MRKSYKIFLIEDCVGHKNEIVKVLNNAAGQYAEKYDFKFEWLQGIRIWIVMSESSREKGGK